MKRCRFLSTAIIVWFILGLWAYNVTIVGFGVGMIWLAFFCLCLYMGVVYALFGKISVYDSSNPNRGREKFFIMAAICITYLPVMTEGFFWHDDWTNFINGFYDVTITQKREITGLLTDMMSFVTVRNSFLLRIIAVIGVIIYAEIIFEILQDKISVAKAVMISLMVAFIRPVVNIVCYGVMFCYPYAFVFSAVSVVMYERALKEEKRTTRVWYIIGTLVCIITSNFIYQISATIAFFILSLFLLYDNKDRKSVFHAIYIPFYIIGTGIYYGVSKLIEIGHGKSALGRGSVISSFQEIHDKCIFFLNIIKKCISQIISSFAPWYYEKRDVEFSLGIVFCIIILIVLFFVGYGLFYSFLKRKDVFGFFTILCLLPLAYYPFLILRENGSASYYCASLCSILVVLIINGVCSVEWGRAQRSFIPILLLVVEMFGANVHQRINWINDANFPYEYVLHELEVKQKEKKKLEWIHIYGAVSPGQVDAYTRKIVQYALEELKIDNRENVKITFSSNKQYSARVTDLLYGEISNIMTDEQKEFFDKYYVWDETGYYVIRPELVLDEDKKDQLHNFFIKVGMIPENSDEALCITLETY